MHSCSFLLNDPAIWGDPETFRPERFMIEHNELANDLPNPAQLIFGFGIRWVHLATQIIMDDKLLNSSRVCPGMSLADRIGFHIAATTMSLFQILPLEGKQAPTPDTAVYFGDLLR
jgi:cytochrome P450